MKDLCQRLNENILKLASQEEHYSNDSFRISELVLCPAKSYYYRKLGLKQTKNGRMFSGTMFHSYLKKLVKRIPELRRAEFEVECLTVLSNGITITGHADAMTLEKVYEFKYSRTDIDRYGFAEHWIDQTNAYASLLHKQNYSLIAVNSESLAVKKIDLPQDQKRFEEMEKKASNIAGCLKKETVPAGPTFQWECHVCELKTICSNYIREHGAEATTIRGNTKA